MTNQDLSLIFPGSSMFALSITSPLDNQPSNEMTPLQSRSKKKKSNPRPQTIRRMNLQHKGAKADEEAQKPCTNEKEEFSIYNCNFFFMTFAVPYSILFCLVNKIAKVKC